MPHYFFDTFNGKTVVPDEEGRDYRSLEAAEVEAEDAARELAATVIIEHKLLDSGELRVSDATGAVVSVVQFKDIVKY